jgi:hypothetical protein
MMTRPASLTELTHFGPSGSGSLLSAVTLALRQGFLLARSLQCRPTDVRPAALRHPCGVRALRLLRSDDSC